MYSECQFEILTYNIKFSNFLQQMTLFEQEKYKDIYKNN